MSIRPAFPLTLFIILISSLTFLGAQERRGPVTSDTGGCPGVPLRALIAELLPLGPARATEVQLDSIILLYKMDNSDRYCYGEEDFGMIDGDFESRDTLLSRWRVFALTDEKFVRFFIKLRLIDWRNVEFSEELWDYMIFVAVGNSEDYIRICKRLHGPSRRYATQGLEDWYRLSAAEWSQLKEEERLDFHAIKWLGLTLAPFRNLSQYEAPQAARLLDSLSVSHLSTLKRISSEALDQDQE